MPAAGAVADDADLAVGSGQRSKRRDGAVGVTQELVVGDAAGLARGGGGVVGVDIEALAGVEVGADGVVAEGGEAPRDLLGRRVPPGQVVDDEDPAEGAVTGGDSPVGVDRRALVAGERHVLGREGFFGCGHGGLLLSWSMRGGAVHAPPTMARHLCPPHPQPA